MIVEGAQEQRTVIFPYKELSTPIKVVVQPT